MNKLTYEKVNNSNEVLQIDLHNGYSVIAISGWQPEQHGYKTSLYLKGNTIEELHLIEDAENIIFHANYKTINSAILKQVATYLEEGFFDKYIKRYDFEMKCFDAITDLIETERIINA